VDFGVGSINFEGAAVHHLVTRSKQKHAKKSVPMDGALAAVLRVWSTRSPAGQPEDWVLVSPMLNGKQSFWSEIPLTCCGLPAAERLGIRKQIGWHFPRGAIATLLRSSDEDAKTTQELTRHVSSKLTLDVFAQFQTPANRAAHLKMVELIRPAAGTLSLPLCFNAEEVPSVTALSGLSESSPHLNLGPTLCFQTHFSPRQYPLACFFVRRVVGKMRCDERPCGPATSTRCSRRERHVLIAVGVTVAPIPIVSLHPVVLPVVLTIIPVLYLEVTPVGAIFAVVPVMVIAMVPIIDPDLYAGLLSSGFDYHRSRCHDSGGQDQRAGVSVYASHAEILQTWENNMQNPGSQDYMLQTSQ